MDFAVLAGHWGKINENEKRDNTQLLLENRKKLWNIKVTLIPIVTGALETIP